MMSLFKNLIFFALLYALVLPITANAQSSTVATFTAKSFYKASTAEDTSANITIGAYPVVSVSTTTVGCDSAAITVQIDGRINGVWSNLLTSDVLQKGKPAGHTLATTKGQVSNYFLRDNGRIADLTQNCSQIRIRNLHAAFANGSTDSTSATSYTQNVVLRKVTW